MGTLFLWSCLYQSFKMSYGRTKSTMRLHLIAFWCKALKITDHSTKGNRRREWHLCFGFLRKLTWVWACTGKGRIVGFMLQPLISRYSVQFQSMSGSLTVLQIQSSLSITVSSPWHLLGASPFQWVTAKDRVQVRDLKNRTVRRTDARSSWSMLMIKTKSSLSINLRELVHLVYNNENPYSAVYLRSIFVKNFQGEYPKLWNT